jgi:twitching motility protein PilT
MRRNELDYILSTMLDFNKDVSDLLFTVDKPLQVEAAGQLTPVPINPPLDRLTPFHTEMIALNLISGSQRLTDDLLRTGSCDASYSLGDRARTSATRSSPPTARTTVFTARSGSPGSPT